MATDWAADVKKYAANADDAIIKGIVRYCGIALTKVDSSLVAFSDPKELDRVRNNFLKKKLGRTEADSVLDAAIAKVGEAMKADRTKNRVTVYYLLADHYKSLGLFAPKAKAVAAKKPAAKSSGSTAAKAAGAAAVVAGTAAAVKKPAAKKAAPAKAPAAKAAAPAKATTAKKAPTKKTVTTAKAAAAGAAAVGAVGLASAIPAAAKGTAAKAVDAVADTAKATAGVASDAAKATASAAVDTGAAVVGAAGAAAVGAAALASGAAGKAASAVSGGAQALTGSANDDESGLGWLWWLLGLALLLFLAWWLFLRGPADEAATSPAATTDVSAAASDGAAATDLAAAPAEGSAAIPTGAGVTMELRDGRPVAKVYFDTGKTAVAPAFEGTAGGLKQWLADHPGSTLAISGYADPSGNAARNAQLAKQRAQAVQASLVKAGIPEASALLVKPDSATDATVAKDAARRVEVVVK